MVSTFTTNINLEEPARGDDVGTWDTPVNNNSTLLDLVCGGTAGVALNNSNVVLSAAQFQAAQIIFSSTLTASVTITFPTSFTKRYNVFNNCTGSSAFTVTLKTTSSAGAFVCAPPGLSCDIVNEGGVGTRFLNLGGPIGSFWDYAGSSMPAWVSGCSLPPYFLCDGSAFDTVSYPALHVILGSSILPDMRGNTRYTLNQGTGRLTTALGGLDGNTNYSLKTTQATLSTSNMPPYTPAGSVTVQSVVTNIVRSDSIPTFAAGGGILFQAFNNGTAVSQQIQSNGTLSGTAQGGVSNAVPVGSAIVAGITLVRAA